MAIPESQLDTWAKQGSVQQSSTTYNIIKNALESHSTPYADKSYKVFLQGSYGNDTNIYAESDVDIVIKLESTFQQDLTRLNEGQRLAFNKAYSNATYLYSDFKRDVLDVLTAVYGKGVKAGSKAITVPAGGSRRKADVIVAVEYRRYLRFNGTLDEDYVEGIAFYTSAGERIINYPKPHSVNLTSKHQRTRGWLKPVVRVFKNLRCRLIDNGKLLLGDAPSYYLEGLLYNVPDEKFDSSYGDCICDSINWIQQAERAQLLCANEQYYLLRNGFHTCWEPAKCEKFLVAAVDLWNDW
jgi:hypothetical protein